MEVIESVPVSEDIKLHRGDYKSIILKTLRKILESYLVMVLNVFAIISCLSLTGQEAS